MAPRTRMPDSLMTQSGWKSRPFRSGRRWGNRSSRNTLASTSSAAAEHFPASKRHQVSRRPQPAGRFVSQGTRQQKSFYMYRVMHETKGNCVVNYASTSMYNLQKEAILHVVRFWVWLHLVSVCSFPHFHPNSISPSLTQVPVWQCVVIIVIVVIIVLGLLILPSLVLQCDSARLVETGLDVLIAIWYGLVLLDISLDKRTTFTSATSPRILWVRLPKTAPGPVLNLLPVASSAYSCTVECTFGLPLFGILLFI